MNKTTEALKLAEEALYAELESDTCEEFAEAAEKCHKALAAIREALAEPVKQEPVAWWNGKETAWFEHELCGWQAPDGCTIPLYAAPVDAKAIRAEALEEAAQECDKWASVKQVSDFSHGSVIGAINCAAAIRGLK